MSESPQQEPEIIHLPRGEKDPGADYSADEREFLAAMQAYKSTRRRPFPTWREVLAVVRSLGWRRVAEPGPLPRPATPKENSSREGK